MGKINTNNYPNRPVSVYQDDDMFILQDNGGETYTTNVGDIKTLIDNKISSSGKADKVSSATAGHLAGLDANGNLTDSGISVSNGTIRATELVTSDGVQANDISYFNEIDMDGSSISGVSTLNVNQIDVHDGQAVEFLTDVVVNGAVADEDGNVLSNKTDKVENATSGNLAGLDSNGNLTDSGVSPTEDVTVEGNPVTFESPFEQDAKSVVVSVKPIQAGSGTPSPENIRPISGIDEVEIEVSGKNLCPYIEVGGLNQTTGEEMPNNDTKRSGFNNVKTGTQYVLSGFTTTSIVGIRLFYYDTNKNYIGNEVIYGDNGYVTFTVGSNVGYVRYQVGVTIFDTNVQLELGSTPTAYEPYVSHTTTIPLPSTLYDADVDVTNGDAVEPLKMVDLGSLNWHYDEPNRRFYSDTIPDAYLNADNESRTGFCMCSDYETFWHHENFDANWDSVAYVAWWEHNPNHIFMVHDHRYTDATAFKNAVSGVQFLYQITTPTTISFDPTDVELLEGTNVVSTNAEKVAVMYGRSLWQDIDDLKTDTEGKLDKSDVATIEGDTASKAYSVNDFMLRADGLYKVTQPIAQNASITASNTTKTTIGAVLTALLNS